MMISCVTALTVLLLFFSGGGDAHEAKDFDDTILYKIDFEMPNIDNAENAKSKNFIRTFHTHDKEKYDCIIPILEESKEEQRANNPELSPYTLLRPLFTSSSCSYRIEAYWSYEICHGQHVRQYHEEREGKNVKFQEYMLGKWSQTQREHIIVQMWEDSYKPDMKYKTTKIDNTKYPYFEVEMTDGTMCDIINAPRTTVVRYVCYPHGKNEIYSFKETSSCTYEAIILTSVLCMIPGFHPEESKEVSIKCYNSLTEPHKPISMLRQELGEMQLSTDDVNGSKEASAAMSALIMSSQMNRWLFMDKFDGDVVVEQALQAPETIDMSPARDFISGKTCLTGGTGWWKYEFCYGRHVRQFHKDKKSEVELYLGYFSEDAHRQWASVNRDKFVREKGISDILWHHYEKGTRCDRTGLPREVDVKLTCTKAKMSATAVSMYLLEPKTCQYILVVESPIVCPLMMFVDEVGLVKQETLQKLIKSMSPTAQTNVISEQADADETPANAEPPRKGVLGPTGSRGNTAASEVDANEDVPA